MATIVEQSNSEDILMESMKAVREVNKKAAKRRREEEAEERSVKYLRTFKVTDVNNFRIWCRSNISCKQFMDVVSVMATRSLEISTFGNKEDTLSVHTAYKPTLDHVFDISEAKGIPYEQRRAIGLVGLENYYGNWRKLNISWPMHDDVFWYEPERILFPNDSYIEFQWIEKENGPKFTNAQKRFVFDSFLFFDKLFSKTYVIEFVDE